MAFYVQFDEQGNITATVESYLPTPKHTMQLVFADYVNTDGKRVNLETRELEDAPVIETEEQPEE